jgi:hypothetical protein
MRGCASETDLSTTGRDAMWEPARTAWSEPEALKVSPTAAKPPWRGQ